MMKKGLLEVQIVGGTFDYNEGEEKLRTPWIEKRFILESYCSNIKNYQCLNRLKWISMQEK